MAAPGRADAGGGSGQPRRRFGMAPILGRDRPRDAHAARAPTSTIAPPSRRGFVVVVDARRPDPLPRLGRPRPARSGRSSSSMASPHGLALGARRPPPAPPSATSSRWTCAATACRMRRPTGLRPGRARRRRRSRSPRLGRSSTGSRATPGRPRRPRVRGDRRRRGRRRQLGGSLRRARPRRRRLGGRRGGERRSTPTSSCAASTSRRRCCARWPPIWRTAAAFDPATWDADQERAARAAVVEVAGRSASCRRPAPRARGSRRGDVRLPARREILAAVSAPIVALVAATRRRR